MRRIALSEIFADGEDLKISGAVFIEQESNGWKSWEVNVDGAESELTQILREKEKVSLKMIATDGRIINGTALATNSNKFQGTGALS